MAKGRRRKGKKWQRKKSTESKDGVERKDGQWSNHYHHQVRENEAFFAYYKGLNIVSEAEWPSFVESLQADLPISFRLNTKNGFHHQIKRNLDNGLYGAKDRVYDLDGKPVFAPSAFPWYPGGHAWMFDVPRKGLKKHNDIPELRALHQLLVVEHDLGTINRQEAVSMIPPLLLDVHPHHVVLDLCAAPGNKTAQLIEALHTPRTPLTAVEQAAFQPSGFVIANDSDHKRAYMLVHQLKRLNSPNYLVTTHEGQFFPCLFTKFEGDTEAEPAPLPVGHSGHHPKVGRKLEFDRILCDVPCSGDGTLRKNFVLWGKWTARMGAGLHNLQLQISRRAISLLKVGGEMVYSTCSFNPVENEAVVAQLLRECDGALELVDCSDRLPGLIREPGLSSWRVQAKDGQWFDTFKDMPVGKTRYLKETMFAPQAAEGADLHLERCVRVLPQRQNTGGFFITLLRKTRPCAPQPPPKAGPTPHQPKVAPVSNDAKAGEGSAVETEAEPADDTQAAKRAKTAGTPTTTSTPPPTTTTATTAVPATPATAPSPTPTTTTPTTPSTSAADVTMTTAPPAPATVADATQAKVPAEHTQGKDKGRRGKGGGPGKRKRAFVEDPFESLSSKAWDVLRAHYDLSDRIQRANLLKRSSQGRKLYLVCEALSGILTNAENLKLEVVHSGLRAFESRPEDHKHGNPEEKACHRLVQEAVGQVAPFMGDRKLMLGLSEFKKLLEQEQTPLDTVTKDPEVKKTLNAMGAGCIVIQTADNGVRPASLWPIYCCFWKTSSRLGVMMNKLERKSYMQMLGCKMPEQATSAKKHPQAKTEAESAKPAATEPTPVPQEAKVEVQEPTAKEAPKTTEAELCEVPAVEKPDAAVVAGTTSV